MSEGNSLDSSRDQSPPTNAHRADGEALILADAKRAVNALAAERKAHNAELEAEKRAASLAVTERFRDRENALRSRESDAREALRIAKDAQPAHEWDGKRVFKINIEYHRFSNSVRKETRLEGIVETRRSGSEFPSNTGSYSLPAMGEGFVRFLKKDGVPGLKFERLYGWRLVEEEALGTSTPSPA